MKYFAQKFQLWQDEPRFKVEIEKKIAFDQVITPLLNIDITLEGGAQNKTINFYKLWPKLRWPEEKNRKFHGGLFCKSTRGRWA